MSLLCVQPGGDGSLHIRVCCKLLGSQLLLSGCKQMAITVSHTSSWTVYSTMAGRLETNPCRPDLMPNDFHLSEPHKKHLVGKQSAVDTNMKQAICLNINQLDALNFIMSLFHASTCFEHTC